MNMNTIQRKDLDERYKRGRERERERKREEEDDCWADAGVLWAFLSIPTSLVRLWVTRAHRSHTRQLCGWNLLTSLKRSAFDGVDRCCCFCFAFPSNLPKTLSTTVLSFSLSLVSLSLFLNRKLKLELLKAFFFFLYKLSQAFLSSQTPQAPSMFGHACLAWTWKRKKM